LQVLLRLRGIALDAARRSLADRLRDEAAAAERSMAIAAAIEHETELQRRQPAERTVDSYAAWLGREQGKHQEAQAASRACTAATAEARVSLNESRAEVRALEVALARLREAREGAAARLEQLAVDEAAARCKRPE
jgi:hypothetical protein